MEFSQVQVKVDANEVIQDRNARIGELDEAARKLAGEVQVGWWDCSYLVYYLGGGVCCGSN